MSSMQPAAALDNVTKSYGSQRGVVDLSLDVRRGEVFGFLGPNGAGKSTTIRLLLDLIRPTRGRVTVLGLDSRREGVAIRRRVGYVPGELALYPRLTGRALLEYLGNLRGGFDRTFVAELVERFQVDVGRPIRSLSRGNKQKLGLLQAFAHRPELLILDEPTAGLDPLMQHAFNALVREVAASGSTVFLSSHVLSEVQDVADRVGIIREGRLVDVEEIAALRRRAIRVYTIRFDGAAPREALAAVPGVHEVEVEGELAHLRLEGHPDALVKELARWRVADLTIHEPDLEDVFLSYYSGGGGAP